MNLKFKSTSLELGVVVTRYQLIKLSEGPRGASGYGVPPGGAASQILAKATDNDFDTVWINQSGAASAKYIHTQSVPALSWIVNHNLGVRPLVALFSPGYIEIEAGILHVSINQFVVSFNSATGGFAVCQ